MKTWIHGHLQYMFTRVMRLLHFDHVNEMFSIICYNEVGRSACGLCFFSASAQRVLTVSSTQERGFPALRRGASKYPFPRSVVSHDLWCGPKTTHDSR